MYQLDKYYKYSLLESTVIIYPSTDNLFTDQQEDFVYGTLHPVTTKMVKKEALENQNRDALKIKNQKSK
jgi:hypothetical protein